MNTDKGEMKEVTRQFGDCQILRGSLKMNVLQKSDSQNARHLFFVLPLIAAFAITYLISHLPFSSCSKLPRLFNIVVNKSS